MFGILRALVRAEVNLKEGSIPMKKLFTLLFAAALAISLAMPVFAQDAAQGSSDQSMSSTTKTKKTKAHKPKKTKAPKDTSAPAQ
jgi:hypothetical protein